MYYYTLEHEKYNQRQCKYLVANSVELYSETEYDSVEFGSLVDSTKHDLIMYYRHDNISTEELFEMTVSKLIDKHGFKIKVTTTF